MGCRRLTDELDSASVARSEGMKMDDLKHLREVLTQAHPREDLSLDALARLVAALEGLPSAALDGGWTFKGFTAYAQALEKDAKRYRWLRDKAPGEIIFDHTEAQKVGSHFLLRVPFDGEPVYNDAHSAVKLDAGIDAAMAAD